MEGVRIRVAPMKFVSIVLTAVLALGSSPAIAQEDSSRCETAEQCLNLGLQAYFTTPRAVTSARDFFQQAVNIEEDFSLALYNLGVAEYELGNYEAAVDAFYRAVYRGDERWGETINKLNAMYNLGVAWVRIEDLRQAEQIFDQVVKLSNGEHRQAVEYLEWVRSQLEEQEN